MRWRTLAWWSGRLMSDNIADLWAVSLTIQDPQIPNLPLETPPVPPVVSTLLLRTLIGVGL